MNPTRETISETVSRLLVDTHHLRGTVALPRGLNMRIVEPMPRPEIELKRLGSFPTTIEVEDVKRALADRLGLRADEIAEVTDFIAYANPNGQIDRFGIVSLSASKWLYVEADEDWDYLNRDMWELWTQEEKNASQQWLESVAATRPPQDKII